MTTWTDKTGRMLTVLPAAEDNPARLAIALPGAEYHPVAFWLDGEADLAEVAVAMFTACGHPAPVILPRPEVDPEVSAEDGDLGVWLSEGGAVMVSLGGFCVERSPEGALKTAALIAGYAEASKARRREQEPDPADVERLSRLIEAGHMEAKACPPGGVVVYSDTLARHLLRAGVSIDSVNLPGEGEGR